MESADNKEGKKNTDSKVNHEIYSKVIRAGNRTYFFDVKSTRSNEYYLTITESKKRFGDYGRYRYEKHKIFLYQEDFENFVENLQDLVDFIHENQPEIQSGKKIDQEKTEVVTEEEKVASFSNVDFDDI
ncbi:MAG: DUF3276 family protein [Prolixibacteraceae bacterium]|nr:DUF3276 family protein [Prolixibacteraceae bacterium]